MKTIALIAIVATAAGIAGCAAPPLTKADVDGRIVCNSEQMDQVERAARRAGTLVHWINCPQATLRAV
jgi:hypothetical protein